MRPDRGRRRAGPTWRRGCSPPRDRHVSAAGPSRHSAYFLLQTLVGAWPVSAERAVAYMEKASREAKLRTSWTDPDPAYEEALRRYVHAVLADDEFRTALTGYVAALTPAARVTSLAQKLIQLTMPGVPDVYQGSETQLLALVDPDNRRPVDFARLAGTLHASRRQRRRQAAAGGGGTSAAPGAAGLLRRGRGLRTPRSAPAAAAEHVVAFARGGRVVTVAPRLALTLARRGGWRDTELTLPPGRWVDVVTGDGCRRHDRAHADLLDRLPVALLARAATDPPEPPRPGASGAHEQGDRLRLEGDHAPAEGGLAGASSTSQSCAPGNGTSCIVSAKLQATLIRPRCITNQRAASSYSQRTRSRRPSLSSGHALRSRMSHRYQASSEACGSRSGSAQSSMECRAVSRVLRIGHVAGLPAEVGELGRAAGPHRLGQLRGLERGEELPRRARSPFLPHEQHRDEGRGQQQRGTHPQQARRDELGQPVPPRAVAHLVVVLQAASTNL